SSLIELAVGPQELDSILQVGNGQPDQSRSELSNCLREALQGSIRTQVDGCPTRVQQHDLGKERCQQVGVTFRGPAHGHWALPFCTCFQLVLQVVKRRGTKLGSPVFLPDVDATRLPIVTHPPHDWCDDLISQGLDRRTRMVSAADECADLSPVPTEHGSEQG